MRRPIPISILFALFGFFLLTSVRAQNVPDNVTGTAANTALDSSANYSSGLPGTSNDVIFTSGTVYVGSFTLNSSPISIGTLNDLNTAALTINASQAITLNGGTDAAAAPGTLYNYSNPFNATSSSDLIYVAPAGSLTIGGAGGIVLNSNGNFDVAATTTGGGTGAGTKNPGLLTINSVISDALSTTFGLTKTGEGTLTLTAANTYTGSTTVAQGNLTLNFTASGAPASNIVNSSSSLVLGGYNITGGGNLTGGTDSSTGTLPTLLALGVVNTATSQTFNGLTLNSGANEIIAHGNGTGSMTLSLGAITVNNGGSVNFSNTGTGSSGVGIFTTSTANDASGILGGFAVINATSANQTSFTVPTDWAANNGSGQIVAYTGYTSLTSGSTIASSTTANYQVTSTSAFTLSTAAGTTDINTFSVNSASTSSTTVTVGGTLRFGADGGVLDAETAASTNYLDFTGGTVTAGGSTNNPGVINIQADQVVRFDDNIVDNGSGAVSIVVNGYAAQTNGADNNVTLYLTGNNTYSGGTIINSGRAEATNGSGFGTGPITIGEGGQLYDSKSNYTLSNTINIIGGAGGSGTVLFNRPAAIRANGRTLTLSGTINLLGDASVDGTLIFTGQITGNGAFQVGTTSNSASPSPSVTLNNATANPNNYTGNTIITEGTLTLGASNQLPDAVSNVNDVGNLILNSSQSAATLNLNGFSDTINGLSSSGSTVNTSVVTNSASGASVLTLGANNATATYNGMITDGGSGKTLSITKIGTGTQTFGGTSSYSGVTTVSSGQLIIGTTAAATSLPNTSSVMVSNSGSLLFGNNSSINTSAAVNVNGGGTIGFTSGSTAISATAGSLTLQSGTAIVDFGSGSKNNTLTFTSLANLSSTATLDVFDWGNTSGNTYGIGGNSATDSASNTLQDHLVLSAGIGTESVALGDIYFYSGNTTSSGFLGTGYELSFGGGVPEEIVPTAPEPSTLFAGVCLVGLLAFSNRRILNDASIFGVLKR